MGIRSHQTKDAIGNAAPLQQHIVLDPVGSHCPLDIQPVRIVIGWLVVGCQKGGGPAAAFGHGAEHFSKTSPGMVELMVAHSRHHSPSHP